MWSLVSSGQSPAAEKLIRASGKQWQAVEGQQCQDKMARWTAKASALGAVIAVASTSPGPHVLLITVDDLRPEIGVFHPWSPADTIITPHLDSLAANGTLFVSRSIHSGIWITEWH